MSSRGRRTRPRRVASASAARPGSALSAALSPLKGKTVAVLESRLGRQLAELVEKHGGLPRLAPALAEVPDIDPPGIARLLEDLESRPPRAVIFQTGVGTAALFGAADSLGATARLLAMLAK